MDWDDSVTREHAAASIAQGVTGIAPYYSTPATYTPASSISS